MINEFETTGNWVDVEKPGGWKLVIDSHEDDITHRLYKKEVSFELGNEIKRADVGVYVEDDKYVYRIDFTFLGNKGFVGGAIFNFAEGGIIIPPLEIDSTMIKEFKEKVKSLTVDFFLLSGSLRTIGSLDLLEATRSLKTIVLMNPEPLNGGKPVD